VILPFLALVAAPVHAGDLEFGYVPVPGPGEQPAFLVTPKRPVRQLVVSCEAGGRTYDFDEGSVAAGSQQRFAWARDTSVTEARCFVRAVFVDDFVEEVNVPIQYQYAAQLSVDLSRATADVSAKTLTVRASALVETADVTAYGAHKAVLDQRTIEIGAGPGEIELPWVGEAEDVVLLDVTLRNGGAWAGFTYSPWFLDIPHDDVLFESASHEIPEDQAFKLEHTLTQLRDVLDKYGEIVPVKLYIAGCTDTVGDAGYNRELSQRRARAIASWLRDHGYNEPIFYYGFGEGLPAVRTGDGVDEPRNRRALYLVGANPPPTGSGVPSVGWIPL